MREHISRNGHRIVYMSRAELEALPGYRGSHHGQRARACCPIHNGDNPTALDIDYAKGWAGCHVCGPEAFSIRIEDHPDTWQDRTPAGSGGLTFGGRPLGGPQRAPEPPKRPRRAPEDTPEQDTGVLEALSARVAAYRATYADSPAAEYARSRGIPDAIAERLGWGYVSPEDRYLARHRLFIPFTDPAGTITGGMGRALDSTTKPKTLNLRNRDGHRTNPVNTPAIVAARSARAPLVVVEGAFDAAACLAGGLRYVVALNGVRIEPALFAGVPRVFLAFDADDTGRAAADRFRRAVPVHAETWADDDLEELAEAGAKDVAAYWQDRGRLPHRLRFVAADQAHPELTEEQRSEAFDLAFTMLCDGWGTWERDARAALANPETPADDRAAIAWALALAGTAPDPLTDDRAA